MRMLLTIVALLSAYITYGQDCSIEGVVKGSKGEPVIQAALYLKDPNNFTQQTQFSDIDGNFKFAHLRPDKYSLLVSYEGQVLVVYDIVVDTSAKHYLSLKLPQKHWLLPRPIVSNTRPFFIDSLGHLNRSPCGTKPLMPRIVDTVFINGSNLVSYSKKKALII